MASLDSAGKSAPVEPRRSDEQPPPLRPRPAIKKSQVMAKPKQAPLVVRVPMGAQRELDQQRKLTQSTSLYSAPPADEPERDEAGPSSAQPVRPVRPAMAAVAAKKSEDERKKAEQKREIERRRQENARRAQQQTASNFEEKKRVFEEGRFHSKAKPTTGKGPMRLSQVEPEDIPTASSKAAEVMKSLKRNFKLDGAKTAAAVPADQKRRRTDELTGSPLESRIRNSVANKEVAKRLVFTQQQPAHAGQPSLMKTAIMHQMKNPAEPFVEGVKFSNEKLRFGSDVASTAMGASRLSKSGLTGSAMRVSHAGTSKHSISHAPAPAPAPQFGSGDNIVLPEIYSESEDDDDDSVILEWANSPELRHILREQQRIDPDTVFGPIAPLQMDEVFKNRSARFRPRSSSANWSNQDRLTPQEIEEYAAEMGYRAGSGRTPNK
ncbi:inner centromere protein [Dipodascopsis tothii]|uniref:inner centromere protein n=1 Tax=Dipodascopsis tothii TaxID=44089 RepID=UPI0034CD4AEA